MQVPEIVIRFHFDERFPANSDVLYKLIDIGFSNVFIVMFLILHLQWWINYSNRNFTIDLVDDYLILMFNLFLFAFFFCIERVFYTEWHPWMVFPPSFCLIFLIGYEYIGVKCNVIQYYLKFLTLCHCLSELRKRT